MSYLPAWRGTWSSPSAVSWTQCPVKSAHYSRQLQADRDSRKTTKVPPWATFQHGEKHDHHLLLQFHELGALLNPQFRQTETVQFHEHSALLNQLTTADSYRQTETVEKQQRFPHELPSSMERSMIIISFCSFMNSRSSSSWSGSLDSLSCMWAKM